LRPFRHPRAKRSDRQIRSRLRRLEPWSAPVIFMSAGALLAGVVEQPMCDVLPDRVAAIQSEGIDSRDFHDPLAAAAGDT
jgi:hypothetical protein